MKPHGWLLAPDAFVGPPGTLHKPIGRGEVRERLGIFFIELHGNTPSRCAGTYASLDGAARTCNRGAATATARSASRTGHIGR